MEHRFKKQDFFCAGAISGFFQKKRLKSSAGIGAISILAVNVIDYNETLCSRIVQSKRE